MRVAYIGNYRAPWCTEVHIAAEIESLGHEVLRIQEPPGGSDQRFLNKVAHQAQGTDLLLFTRTWGLPPAATDLWRHLEAFGTVTASYHLDLYVGLEREGRVEGDPFWTTQHVFTPDGNPDSAAWFAAHGINHHWSPPAVYSAECATVMPGRHRPEFAHDVVFVGSYGYHPEWPRAELIDWLTATYGDRFRRYGGDTTPGPVRGQDLNDLYASCKVVVGDSCFARPDTLYVSDRFFETWGRGGFLLHPQVDFLGREVGAYPAYTPGDWDGLSAAIDFAVDHDEYRRQAAATFGARVAAGHTYRHRLAAAFETMGLT